MLNFVAIWKGISTTPGTSVSKNSFALSASLGCGWFVSERRKTGTAGGQLYVGFAIVQLVLLIVGQLLRQKLSLPSMI